MPIHIDWSHRGDRIISPVLLLQAIHDILLPNLTVETRLASTISTASPFIVDPNGEAKTPRTLPFLAFNVTVAVLSPGPSQSVRDHSWLGTWDVIWALGLGLVKHSSRPLLSFLPRPIGYICNYARA
jgi:hypothetical protein